MTADAVIAISADATSIALATSAAGEPIVVPNTRRGRLHVLRHVTQATLQRPTRVTLAAVEDHWCGLYRMLVDGGIAVEVVNPYSSALPPQAAPEEQARHLLAHRLRRGSLAPGDRLTDQEVNYLLDDGPGPARRRRSRIRIRTPLVVLAVGAAGMLWIRRSLERRVPETDPEPSP